MFQIKNYSSTFLKAISITLIGTFLGQLLNFFHEVLIAANFGTSWKVDAYLFAMTIFTIIGMEPIGWLNSVFIPMYSTVREKNGIETSNEFFNIVFSAILIFSCIIAIFGIIIGPYVIQAFTPEFSIEAKILSVSIFRYLLIFMILSFISNLLSNILYANKHFSIPAFSKALIYAITIVCIISFTKIFDIYVLVIGIGIGTLIFIIFQMIVVSRFVKIKINLNFHYPHLKEMLRLVYPLIGASFANQINILVERIIAATFVEGTISSLNYAIKLTVFPVTFFLSSIMIVLFPKFADLATLSKNELFILVKKVIKLSFLILIPTCLLLMFLAHPIVAFLFQRGSFTSISTSMTSNALIFYAPGLIGLGGVIVLSRVYLAMKDTRTLTKIGVLVIFINILCIITLTRLLGVSGIPLSFSFVSTLHFVLLWYNLKKIIWTK